MRVYISNTTHLEWRQAHFALDPQALKDEILTNAMRNQAEFLKHYIRAGAAAICPVPDSDPRLGTFEV